MNKYMIIKQLTALLLAAGITVLTACFVQTSTKDESTPETGVSTDSEITPESSETVSSDITQESGSNPNINHPSYLVGKWSLKIDMTHLESSEQAEAAKRMEKTAMVLNADGTVVGIYGENRTKGQWGENDGYVYVTLKDETEYFSASFDTLESMNYPGMSFVK
jgi:predicted component of type VI protein secretion system